MSILSGLISRLFLTSEETGIGATTTREAYRYVQQVLDEQNANVGKYQWIPVTSHI